MLKMVLELLSYYPMKIGNYVHVGDGSIVEAASVGEGVIIGRNCVIVSFHDETLSVFI